MSFEERRYLPSQTTIEVKGWQPKIVGYAAVFNSPSEELTFKDGRRFREIVRPSAFTESLRTKADVLARFEHGELLARVSNGTLRLTEDSRGLRYEIDPANTTAGRDAVELIRRRDVPYSSFAFSVLPGGDTWRREGSVMIRELRSIVLLDVSPVAKPAYTVTDVALRSFEQWSRGSYSFRNLRRARLALAERM